MVYCSIRNRTILDIGEVDDEEEYDTFDNSSSFTNPKSIAKDDGDASYMDVDHTERIHLKFDK